MSKVIDGNRILISATGSGKGKTTLSTALMYLFKEKGLDVRGFKCGPDYIDPMYHETVLKVSSKNLDPFFADDELLKASFYDSMGQLNIIEGCMGLFDGLGVSMEHSSYSVAKALNAPIILVVDGYGAGYSIVAQIKGFLAMDDARLIKGVFLNRVSVSYCEKLKAVIEAETGIRVVGNLPVQKEDVLGSRHLGLLSPEENNALEVAKRLASVLKDSIDFEALEAIYTNAKAVSFERELKDYIKIDLSQKKIAVARDEAFNFYYKDNLEALKLAGAELLYFSPIHDEALPKEANALYIGGGYPELYLNELEENTSMKESLYWAICDGMPTFAECGGFMYLQKQIEGKNMVGVLADRATNMNKLVRFGYVTGRYKSYVIKGHEFHHFDVVNPGNAFLMTKASTQTEYQAVWNYKRLIAGFPHFYFLSDPDFLKEFI